MLAALDSTAPPRTFIEVTEVWAPGPDGRLTRTSGIYGLLGGFEAASGETSFARGEGLPGKAWEEGRPVVLKGFRGSYFKRTEAAEAAGLTTAVAVPVFAGETLKGVIVFLCADDAVRTGAIEIWRSDQGSAMKLEDGYFGAATHFEWVSKHTQFPRGQGLPGGVWASGAPMLMRDLGTGYRFIRAESAGKAGLTTGLGLPIEVPGEATYVVTLLSARGTPIAGRYELWDVVLGRAGAAPKAVRVDGICGRSGPLWASPRTISPWEGPLGEVLATQTPLARDEAPGLPEGFDAIVALPLHRGGELSHIAAWYF
ncbi:MAG: GAF domain-containing protein [Pseudomonadota bacterium]